MSFRLHIGDEEYPRWMNSLDDKHTWLNDVREYLKMLNGDISIPHAIGNYGKYRPTRINCITCLEAYNRRAEYQEQRTILSKET